MHNQRLLYSQSKRPRPGSINKQNNIKLFNETYLPQSSNNGIKKSSAQLRYDYDNHTRIQHKNRTLGAEEKICLSMQQKQPYNNQRELSPKQRSDVIISQRSKPPKQLSALFLSSLASTSSHQQIESYTNKLLQNNKLYQQQIFSLKQQHAQIRSQLQMSIAQTIRLKMYAQKSQQQLKLKFTNQISQLVTELKQILSAKQQMQKEYNVYINQLSSEHSHQLKVREQSFLKSQSFFKEKLSSLQTFLESNKIEKQKQYFQASQLKLKLMKQLDQMRFQVQKANNQKKQYRKQNQQLIKIIKQLQKQQRQVKQTLQQSQLKVFQIQTQKNQIIIQLKNQNKTLCDGVKQMQNKITQLDHSMQEKQLQFSRLEKQLYEMKRQVDDYSKKLIVKNLENEELRNKGRGLEEQSNKQSQTFNYQKNNFQRLVSTLEGQVKALSSQLAEVHSKHRSLQKKSQTLSSQLEVIQKEKAKLLAQYNQLSQLNKKYKHDNIQMLQQLQILHLQTKSLKQQKTIKQNHNKTLQKLCQQLQTQLQKLKQRQKQTGNQNNIMFIQQREKQLQTKNILFEIQDKRYLQLRQQQKLIKDKYEKELELVEEENENLRRQNLQLQDDISSLIKQYQQTIQQKQLKWRIRVQSIQKEIEGLFNNSNSNNNSNNNITAEFISNNKYSNKKDTRYNNFNYNNIEDNALITRREYMTVLKSTQKNQRTQRNRSNIKDDYLPISVADQSLLAYNNININHRQKQKQKQYRNQRSICVRQEQRKSPFIIKNNSYFETMGVSLTNNYKNSNSGNKTIQRQRQRNINNDFIKQRLQRYNLVKD